MSRLVPKRRFREFSGEWEEKPLEGVSDFINEKVSLIQINLDNYISTENLLENFGGITKSSKLPNITNVTKFKKDDVLMSNIRPYLKKIWLANIEGGASNDIIVTRVKKDNSYKFLLYIVQNDKFIDYVMQGAKGVKMPRGDIALIKKYPLFIPKPKEQQKIANCLSSLDSLIEAQNKKVEALKEHKKGLMQQLFPSEGETVPKLCFDGFSGEWEEDSLGNIVKFLDGKRKPIKESDRASIQGEYPYYGASGIIDYVNDYIFDEDLILLGEDGENIVSRNSPLVFKVSGKCWINNHAHVLKPNKPHNLDFFVQYMETLSYLKYNSGGAQPKLNQAVCKTIPLLFPKPKEQQKIANCLSSLDSLIEVQNKKVETLKKHKKGLMQQLFVSSEVNG